METWRTFLDALKGDLPDFVIGDATATVDASLRCAVYPRDNNKPPHADWAVVGCVSILAPVYTLYAVHHEFKGGRPTSHELFFPPLPPEWRDISHTIARRIEATFNVSALSRETAEMPIPLCVDPHQPPDTTLFHALFTSRPQSVP
ncbi:hypothetical protein [Melittangium boletus]|nr:hypothetical protein [Melittangium boletus]